MGDPVPQEGPAEQDLRPAVELDLLERAPARVRGGERHVTGRVPVLGRVDGAALIVQGFRGLSDLVDIGLIGARNGQRPRFQRGEIPLMAGNLNNRVKLPNEPLLWVT